MSTNKNLGLSFSGFASFGIMSADLAVPQVAPAPVVSVPVADRCYCHACCCGDGFCIREPRVFYGTPKKRSRSSRKGTSR